MSVGLWIVVGGGDKGGILVREGKEGDSPQLPERLATGSLLKELDLQGNRLCFQRIDGGGPSTGWVSLRLDSGKDLVVTSGVWKVVGGVSSGGILVREGIEGTSPQCSERLATEALVKQVALEGDRLQYSCLTGNGPRGGWVTVKLDSGKELLEKLDDQAVRGLIDYATSQGAPSAEDKSPAKPSYQIIPLEIQAKNEEKDFSYEGQSPWVSEAAAVAKLWRESKPFMPPDDGCLPRGSSMKPLEPYKKITPKKLKEVSKQDLPGCLFGLSLPMGSAQMTSSKYGAEWLTTAFHKAGTLSSDNRVTKIVNCKELPIAGFDTAGGAALKYFLTVQYDRAEPNLHTELFVKYPWDATEQAYQRSNGSGDDGIEVQVNLMIAHAFPFRSPKCYFADISRETTNYILITEAIPYEKREMAADGKSAKKQEFPPYTILPSCGKFQDFLLPEPEEYYAAIFRAKGRLAGWDHLGRFDQVLGPMPRYSEEQYLPGIIARPPQPTRNIEMIKEAVGTMLDKGIDFFLRIAPNLAPPQLRDEGKLQKARAEMLEMSPYFKDMSDAFQNNCSDFIGASHANLQADNAYFWRDEYGDLTCGILDWGSFLRAAMPVRFLGCLSGAEAHLLVAHLEGILKNFVDEFARCGGPKIRLDDLVLRYHLGQITNVYDSNTWLEKQVYKETAKEEFAGMADIYDAKFQNRFLTRCGALTTIQSWAYYVEFGRSKAIFDEWAAGRGKQYLTLYQ